MRRLYAHAFTDTALLEQAPLLTRYFELLVFKLKQKIDGPEQGRVDLMAYYNFTTFDIIGYSFILTYRLETGLKVYAGISHLASPLGRLRLANTIRGSSYRTISPV